MMPAKGLSAVGSRGGSPPLSPLSRRFGENLVVGRLRLDLSQVEAARRAGLHRTEISLLERGLRLPEIDTIVKVSGALEVEPCQLLAGLAWRPAVRLVQGSPTYLRLAPNGAPAADRAGRY